MLFCNTPKREQKVERVLTKMRIRPSNQDEKCYVDIVAKVVFSRPSNRRNAIRAFENSKRLDAAEEAAVALSISPSRSSIAKLDELIRVKTIFSYVFIEALHDIIQTSENPRIRRMALDVLLDHAISDNQFLSSYAKAELKMFDSNDIVLVDETRRKTSRMLKLYEVIPKPLRVSLLAAAGWVSFDVGKFTGSNDFLIPLLSGTLGALAYATWVGEGSTLNKHTLLQSLLVDAEKRQQ